MNRDVVFWFPSVDPYYVDRFEALERLGSLNFECWYTRAATPGRSWIVDHQNLRYSHRFVRTLGKGYRSTGLPVTEWASAKPRLLVTYHGHPSVAGSIVIRSVLPNTRLAFYAEMTFPRMVPKPPAKEIAKKVLLQRADALLTPGTASEQYFRRYTRLATPIYRLNHVLRRERFVRSIELRESGQAATRKRQLRLEGFVFLYVGKISFHKGVDVLIDSFANLERDGFNCSLLLVGDGEERSHYQAMVSSMGLRRVRFHEFVQQERIGEIYALGDALVFASRSDSYGLVIDEAMAAGLPVISSTSVGDVADRVVSNETGLLVPPEDIRQLQTAMRSMVCNQNATRAMGNNASVLFSNRTPEYWANQVTAIVEHMLR